MNWIDSQLFLNLWRKKVCLSLAVLAKRRTFAPVKNEKVKHS